MRPTTFHNAPTSTIAPRTVVGGRSVLADFFKEYRGRIFFCSFSSGAYFVTTHPDENVRHGDGVIVIIVVCLIHVCISLIIIEIVWIWNVQPHSVIPIIIIVFFFVMDRTGNREMMIPSRKIRRCFRSQPSSATQTASPPRKHVIVEVGVEFVRQNNDGMVPSTRTINNMVVAMVTTLAQCCVVVWVAAADGVVPRRR